ncbi:hypothetical protein NEISICOT_03701 [Neisseria sicca ATCC 29256]|uniref:Uncharacterized protein n=1 Tax=Neisseria sicca ATCC 29256 TaxID=547045 RepID=C6MAW9_NEISI|nr:hypothetical protein NEISICOT_03701 [Neisseria sicca ATCC 29256]
MLKTMFSRRTCQSWRQPPSGGCVLKRYKNLLPRRNGSSRLRAAVC